MGWFGLGDEAEKVGKGVNSITSGVRHLFTGEIPPDIILELDKIDSEHTTTRWEADSRIKWYHSSRSIVLLWITFIYTAFITLDAYGIKINQYWIDSITGLMMVVYGAFFGGKSLEIIRGKKV